MVFNEGWPRQSSHAQQWLFSPKALQAERQRVHEAAREAAQSLSPAVDVPTLDQIHLLVQYYTYQLVNFCQSKNIGNNVIETACLFLVRYFLKISVMQSDIRIVMFACLTLALKAEDVARSFYMSDIFGDIDDLNTESVLDLELPVCDALNFHLVVLHVREPLWALREALLQKVLSLDKNQNEKAPRTAAGGTGTDATGKSRSSSEEYEALVQRAYDDSERECLLMYQSVDIPLLHPPAVMALAAFLQCAQRGLGGLLNVEAFARTFVCQGLRGGAGSATAGQDSGHHEDGSSNEKGNGAEGLTASSSSDQASSGEAEETWRRVLLRVEDIYERLRQLHERRRYFNSSQYSSSIGEVLEKCVDIIEGLQSTASSHSKEKKKRKKEKKRKRAHSDVGGRSDVGSRSEVGGKSEAEGKVDLGDENSDVSGVTGRE